MRLLKRNTAGNVSLTKDISEAELRSYTYAILSHTWGADEEEVTYDDVVNGVGTTKPGAGSEKIRFCVQQTRQDGLEYFWVDTCCINKTNLVELSRALLSMYRWYSNAARCYVFLSDVEQRDEKAAGKTFEHQFRTSRWFTRGWTLQELLAPRYLDFFSKDACKLGSKTSLAHVLSEVTRIPIAALHGQPLSTFSLGDRLSWQEGRGTKEEEDMVYSLFGLLHVSMPVLYGEGRAKAWARLQQELAATLESKGLVLGNATDLSRIAKKLVTACHLAGRARRSLIRLSAVCDILSDLLRRVEGFCEESVVDLALLVQCIQTYGQDPTSIVATMSRLDKLVQGGFVSADGDMGEIDRLIDDMELSKQLFLTALDIYHNKRRYAQWGRIDMIARLSAQVPRTLQHISSGPNNHPTMSVQHASSTNLAEHVRTTAVSTLEAQSCQVHTFQWHPHRKKAARPGFRMTLGWKWLSQTIFEIMVINAQFGWDVSFRMWHELSLNSEMVRYCMSGNIQGVRDLVDAGAASVRDRLGSLTSLWFAANGGHIDLCRYLLSNMTHVEQREDMRTVMETFCLVLSASAVSMYRLFIEEYGADVDLEFGDDVNPRWWQHCPSKECRAVVMRHMSLPWRTRTIEERFHHAMQVRLISPGDFLHLLGLDVQDSRLISLRNKDGASALHHVAHQLAASVVRRIGYPHSPVAGEWTKFGTQLLKNGLDAHDTQNDQHTALAFCIAQALPLPDEMTTWPYTYQELRKILQLWFTMVQDAGLDPQVYAGHEHISWRSHSISGRRGSRPNARGRPSTAVVGIGLSPSRTEWNVEVLESTPVDVYGLDVCPGSFERDLKLPPIICWSPHGNELQEGHWSYLRSIEVNAARVNPRGRSAAAPDPFVSLIDQAQDDTGVVALLLEQFSHGRDCRRRSYSAPPPTRRREAAYFNARTSDAHAWLPAYHLCPRDARYGIGCKLRVGMFEETTKLHDIRDCGKSVAPEDASLHSSSGWQFHSFLGVIWRCQTGALPRRDKHVHAAGRHDGTSTCPQGCAGVDLKQLRKWRAL